MSKQLSVSEKLVLLNSIEIVENEADGETLYYALAEDNEENRNVLYKLGLDDQRIKQIKSDDEHIDLVHIAFKEGGASWYDSEFGWLDKELRR